MAYKPVPDFRGPKANKRTAKYFSSQAHGIAAVAADNYPKTADKLELMGDRLSILAETAKRTADIHAVVIPIFERFLLLKDSILNGDGEDVVEELFCGLESDISVMSRLLERNIAASPIEDITDRRVLKFMYRKEAVKRSCSLAERSLNAVRARRQKLLSKLENFNATARDELALKSLDNAVLIQEEAFTALSSISDKLSLIEGYAKLSPKLAKKLCRLINLKVICDIFYNPLKAKRERDIVNCELYYIFKNVSKSNEDEIAWSNVIYAKTSHEEGCVAEEQKREDGLKGQKDARAKADNFYKRGNHNKKLNYITED